MTKRLVVKEFDRIVSALSISGGIKDPVAEYIDAYGVYALDDEYFQKLKQRLLGKNKSGDLPRGDRGQELGWRGQCRQGFPARDIAQDRFLVQPSRSGQSLDKDLHADAFLLKGFPGLAKREIIFEHQA